MDGPPDLGEVLNTGWNAIDGPPKKRLHLTITPDTLAIEANARRTEEGILLRPQPLIAVHDVEASSLWYQRLFGWESGHGGKEYERLVFEGELMLQLHRWSAHDHPHLGNVDAMLYGNGVLLWYQISKFDATIDRARSLEADILEGPRVNQSAQHRECWFKDPDGYVIVVASCRGDLG